MGDGIIQAIVRMKQGGIGRTLKFVMLTEIGHQQQQALVCRDMCDLRMAHIA